MRPSSLIRLRPAVLCFVFASAALLFMWPRIESAQTSTPAHFELFTGEFTNPTDPAIAYDFYVQNGSLVVESARMVPTELKPVATNTFGADGSNTTITFTLDPSGRARSVAVAENPDVLFVRTGAPVRHNFHDYVRTEAMIPMRDGVKLHAVILTPADITTPLPILMQRTPYGVDETSRASFFMNRPELARAGYIYVGEDIRGRYKSQGKFVMMRPLADHQDSKAIDESTDAYDTVDWLIKNVPGNNGRVGVVGTSYPGFLATMAGIDPHPAVKAISPQAPMIDVWMGDDFFHNGAFRQSYGYDYVFGMESSKVVTKVNYGDDARRRPHRRLRLLSRPRPFLADCQAVRLKSSAHLEALPRSSRLRQLLARRAALNTRSTPSPCPRSPSAAITTRKICGDRRRNTPSSSRMTRITTTSLSSAHGVMAIGLRRRAILAISTTASPSAKSFARRSRQKFFAHYLKDEPGFDLQNTASFQTGSNTWKYYAQFPPADIAAHEPASRRRRTAHIWRFNHAGRHFLCQRSRQSRSLSSSAHPAHLQSTARSGTTGSLKISDSSPAAKTSPCGSCPSSTAISRSPAKSSPTSSPPLPALTTTSSSSSSTNTPATIPTRQCAAISLLTNAEIFRGRYLSGFDRPSRARARLHTRIQILACTTSITSSRPATPSWSKFKAPGSRSTTATRKPSCPTS